MNQKGNESKIADMIVNQLMDSRVNLALVAAHLANHNSNAVVRMRLEGLLSLYTKLTNDNLFE